MEIGTVQPLDIEQEMRSAAGVVWASDEVTLISTGGMVLRTAVDDIPRMGRAMRGAKVMELKKGDEVTSVAVVSGEG